MYLFNSDTETWTSERLVTNLWKLMSIQRKNNDRSDHQTSEWAGHCLFDWQLSGEENDQTWAGNCSLQAEDWQHFVSKLKNNDSII